jgi:hypothetical protein
MRQRKKWLASLALIAGLAASGDALAQCAVTQATPKFTGAAGTVFGRIASQWDQYFGSKVSANNGMACGLTLQGTINAAVATLIGFLAAEFSTLLVNQNDQPLPTPPPGTLIQGGAADGATARLTVNSFGAAGNFTCQVSGGTNPVPAAVAAGTELCSWTTYGYNGVGYTANPAAGLRMFAGATWTPTSSPTELRFSTTPVGSVTMADRWRIDANGALFSAVATGGGQATGSVNSTGYYVNGTLLTAVLTATAPLQIVANAVSMQNSPTFTGTLGTAFNINTSGTIASGAITSSGAVTANTNITATTGNITATAGNITATAGDIAIVAAKSYLSGGALALNRSGNYTAIYDNAGHGGFYTGNATGPENIYRNTSHQFADRAGSAIFATINSSGLVVTGGVTASTGLAFTDRTSLRGWQWYGSGDVANLFNGTGNVVTVSAAGALTAAFLTSAGGITSASGNITAVGGNFNASGTYQINGSNVVADSTSYRVLSSSSADALLLGNSADPENYYRNGSHRFQNVGGGTTYMDVNSAGISVYQAVAVTLGVTAASANIGGLLTLGDTTSIGGGGQLCIANSQVRQCASSLRFKKNVETTNLGLKEAMRLRPVAFDWKGGEGHDLGFIAEELEDINPLLARREGDHVDGLKPNALMAVLAAAIQDQQRQIEDLKRRLDSK